MHAFFSPVSVGASVGAMLLCGPILALAGVGRWIETQLSESPAQGRARTGPLGAGHMSGIARSKAPQQAPVSGVACCWWHCRLQELRADAKPPLWRTLRQFESEEQFYIEDARGRVLVQPRRTEWNVPSQITELNGAMRVALRPLLHSWGIDENYFFSLPRRLRISEQLIADGAAVSASGEFMPQRPVDKDSSREKTGDLLAAEKVVLQASAEGRFAVVAPSFSAAGTFHAVPAPVCVAAGVIISACGVWMAFERHWSPFLIIGLAGLACLLHWRFRKF